MPVLAAGVSELEGHQKYNPASGATIARAGSANHN